MGRFVRCSAAALPLCFLEGVLARESCGAALPLPPFCAGDLPPVESGGVASAALPPLPTLDSFCCWLSRDDEAVGGVARSDALLFVPRLDCPGLEGRLPADCHGKQAREQQ